jgi:branched-chain amino acid transport system permease protein
VWVEFQKFGIRTHSLSLLAIGIILLVLPFALPYYDLASEIIIFALAAVAYDLTLGYTGLLSFGHGAFFGIGAYTAGLLTIHFKIHILFALILSGLTAGLAATIIGIVILRQTGTYFAMLTLAFNQAVFFAAFRWTSLTGGDSGLAGLERPPLYIPVIGQIDLSTPLAFYYFVAVMFFLLLFGIKRITNSPFGRVLQAIRESETRAQMIGYSSSGYKLFSFLISALVTGVAGGLHAFFIKFVSTESCNFILSGNILIMNLIGGTGTLFGPIFGAIMYVFTADFISAIFQRWQLIFGIVFVAFTLFLRQGIYGLIRYIITRGKTY